MNAKVDKVGGNCAVAEPPTVAKPAQNQTPDAAAASQSPPKKLTVQFVPVMDPQIDSKVVTVTMCT